jgi:hypothetical protein
MDGIDKLLAELQTEYKNPKPSGIQPQPNAAQPLSKPLSKGESLIDNLLEEVKADFTERDIAQEARRQQELKQEQIRQEQLQAKQLEALKTLAKEWLEKLDPLSPEGLWFERFAEGYPSKLDAAIEYLKTNA